jgi:transposase
VRDDRPAGDTTPAAVWFAYSPDRKGEHPQAHLGHFTGTLQADGYAGFDAVYETGRIQEAACWAHVRRKFYDLHVAHQSPVAAEAMERIAALYAIEKEIRGHPADERREVRGTRARPLLDSLKQWLEETLGKLSRKSDTAMAVRYALSRWEALLRYCDDGRIEIDNNAAERSLRTVALGRKNYLFAGSDAGGERAAAIYSLIGSAKLNGLDPEAYLRNVLSRIADHPHRRTPALELRATICHDIHQRRLANLAPCQHGQVRTLTVDPVYALVVHHPLRRAVLLLPPQHFMHPPVAKARTLARNFPQPRSQRCVLAFSTPITATPSVRS